MATLSMRAHNIMVAGVGERETLVHYEPRRHAHLNGLFVKQNFRFAVAAW